MTKYDEIIPLGYDCTIARQLDNLSYRHKAYPFDWLVTIDTKLLVDSILDEFDKFYDVKKNINGIYTNPYNMIFLHHSNFDIETFNFEFNKKIKRFKKIINSNEKILIIRKLHGTHEDNFCSSTSNNEIDINYMSKLRDYIDKVNPNNNIDITILISCENCCSSYKGLLSNNNRMKVDVLYEPNGDDNNIYKNYLQKINEV
jgi:hypothetical protein